MRSRVPNLGLLACEKEAPAAPADAESPRIIAMGDVHGDRDAALDALELAGVVDSEGHWIGRADPGRSGGRSARPEQPRACHYGSSIQVIGFGVGEPKLLGGQRSQEAWK